MTMRLFLLQPEVIFEALVNQGTYSYPIDEVEFDNVSTGAYGDIEPGMTIYFGSTQGGFEYGIQRIRKAATSDTIYFGRASYSDLIGTVMPANNCYITVLNDYRVWSKVPYIDTDGNIFKDSDLTVGTSTGDDIPPVANAGVGFAATIDSGTSVITAAWDASTNSFAVADGAAIDTYAWDVDDGTITVGSSSTAAITATFPAGFRWVKLTVTDDNGISHYMRMPVYARDPAADTTISSFQITNHRITPQGQQIDLEIREAIAEGTYPDGTLVMIWEDEPADEDDRDHMVFIGWHHTDPSTIDSQRTGIISNSTLQCLDVAGKLDALAGYTQEVESNSVPSTWNEMKNPNMDKYLHYLLYWHSTALELADWTDSGTGSAFPFVILGSDGESIFDQVDRRAKALVPDYRLTCNTHGQLLTRVDQMLQDTGDRSGTTPVVLAIDDWRNITYTRKPPAIHWLRGEAIVADQVAIEAVFCVAPGEAPGYGVNEHNQGEQLAQSQSDLNHCEGHRWARLNASESYYTITLNDSDDRGIEPAMMQWTQLTITAAVAAKRGLAFTTEDGIVREINISYSHGRGGLVKTVTLTWERETSGYPAATYYPPEGDYEFDGGWDWGDLPTGEGLGDWDFGLVKGLITMGAFDRSGSVWTTTDFDTPSGSGGPTWVETALGVSGTPQIFIVDAYSPGYTGIGGTAINGWLATKTGIYRVSDIFGTPTASLQHTFTGGTVFGLNMDFSFGSQGWGVCVYNVVSSGVYCTYTLDGGATWSADARITTYNCTSTPVGGIANFVPGLYVSPKTPGLVYAGAWNATGASGTAHGSIYKSTNYGASWVSGSSDFAVDFGDALGWDLHVPYARTGEDKIYYSTSIFGGGYFDINLEYATSGGNVSESVHAPEWGHFSIHSSPQDETFMAFIGRNQAFAGDGTNTLNLRITTDGGTTWPNQDDWAILSTGRVAIAGDNKYTIFAWGSINNYVNALLRYSEDSFATSDSRIGNMSTSGLIGICGGPTV